MTSNTDSAGAANRASDPRSEFAIVGRVRKAQGIQGDVTVELLTDEPERFFARGARVFAGTVDGDIARDPLDRRNPESRQTLTVEQSSPYRGGMVVKFDAIPDRTVADLWRQRYLLVPAAELTPPAEDEVYMHDLIGMRVQDEAGAELGEVTGLYELPQGLTLDMRVSATGASVLIPYRPDIVREVDLDGRVITITIASGLLE